MGKELVMIFAGGNYYMIGKDFINQPMFLGDAAGPKSGQIPFKWFRFAGSVKRIPHYLGNKCIDLINYFFVFFGPLAVFGKSGFFKTDEEPSGKPLGIFVGKEIYYTGGVPPPSNHRAAHSSAHCRACSMVSKEIRFFPRSTFSTAFSKCSLLAGELRRYSVSSCSRTIISNIAGIT
jgi:hypothetical protein